MAKAEDPARLVSYITLQHVSREEFHYGGEVTVRLHCKRHMPTHQIPAAFVVLDQVTWNPPIGFTLRGARRCDTIITPRTPRGPQA